MPLSRPDRTGLDVREDSVVTDLRRGPQGTGKGPTGGQGVTRVPKRDLVEDEVRVWSRCDTESRGTGRGVWSYSDASGRHKGS